VNDIDKVSERKPAPATAGSTVHSAPVEPQVSELLNRGYVCAPGEGVAWQAAFEAGVDMSLLEDALRMSPDARLREHQRALDQILALIKARPSHDSGS